MDTQEILAAIKPVLVKLWEWFCFHLDRFIDWLVVTATGLVPRKPVPFVHPIHEYGKSSDPQATLQWDVSRPSKLGRLPIGATATNFVWTSQFHIKLTFGQPRVASKTSSQLIPDVLAHVGPVFCVSTRDDIANETAMARSRVGSVMRMDLNGRRHPGFLRSHFNPLDACIKWDGALSTATTCAGTSHLANAGRGGQSDVAAYFDKQAIKPLAASLYYAALSGHDMVSVADLWSTADDEQLLQMAEELQLDVEHSGSVLASNALNAYLRTPDREKGSTRNTIIAAIDWCYIEAIRELMAKPDSPDDVALDPEAFYCGDYLLNDLIPPPDNDDQRHLAAMGVHRQPCVGHHDTLYITGDAVEQAQPYIVLIGKAFASAAAKHKRLDDNAARQGRYPLLYALDEVSEAYPDPDLPKALSTGGGNNCIYSLATQSIGMLQRRWGTDLGTSMMGLCNVIVALRGIRDPQTLAVLEDLGGYIDIPKHGMSESRIPNSWRNKTEWLSNEGTERVPRFPKDQISTGDPNNPDASLVYFPDMTAWLTMLPYYRSNPWQGYLVKMMFYVAGGPNCLLPIPSLGRNASDWVWPEYGEWFHKHARMILAARAKEGDESSDNPTAA